MIDEKELSKLCSKYKIKYQYFPNTKIILIDTGIDEYKIRYNEGKEKPYVLLHKNKCRQKSKFHTQRKLRTLFQTIDSIARHKNVLSTIYDNKCRNCHIVS